MKEKDYEKLEHDLNDAWNAALEAYNKNSEDGGTCNFDSVIIQLKGARKDRLSAFDFRIEKYRENWYFVEYDFYGQAGCRTRMAEAAVNKLKELGYNASVWYCMD